MIRIFGLRAEDSLLQPTKMRLIVLNCMQTLAQVRQFKLLMMREPLTALTMRAPLSFPLPLVVSASLGPTTKTFGLRAVSLLLPQITIPPAQSSFTLMLVPHSQSRL